MTEERRIETHETGWRGIRLRVTYEADYLNMAERFPHLANAHLQIEAVDPEKAPLPVTETGYRSHFTAARLIEETGGPVAFVLAWLEDAAQEPAWQDREAAARQFSLFD